MDIQRFAIHEAGRIAKATGVPLTNDVAMAKLVIATTEIAEHINNILEIIHTEHDGRKPAHHSKMIDRSIMMQKSIHEMLVQLSTEYMDKMDSEK